MVGFGQFGHEVYADWEGGNAIGVFGRYQMASNAMTAQMANAIFTGSELDRDMRQATADRLTATNRLGLDGDFGLYYRHLPDSSKGLGFFVRIADRYHAHATLTDDLLNFAMFGNAQFAGQTADFSTTTVSYLQYKQYELGLLKTWTRPKATWRFGFGLSLLTGNQAFDADFTDAGIYTHPDGEYLDISVSGTARSSSIASSQYFDANGWGFSASAHVSMVAEKFGLKFEMDDIGMLAWQSNLRHHDLDTTAHFEGVVLDLFGSGPLVATNADTVLSGLVTSSDGNSFIMPTPGSLRLEGFYKLNAKDWRLYLGVHHRFANGYFPLIYLGTSAPLPKRFFIDGRFAYGGFGSWNVGLEVRKNFGGHFAIRLGTYNLEGYLVPMAGTAQSAYLGLTGYF